MDLQQPYQNGIESGDGAVCENNYFALIRMKLLEPYYRINEAAGLDIGIRQDGTAVISCCSLLARGNQLTIARKFPDINELEDLVRYLPPKTAVALNLSGRVVLHKQLEGTETIGPKNFNKVLPNANVEDFYVQQFISGDFSFISVIRRAEAERWINRLNEYGLEPFSLSLGPFPVAHVLNQLNSYGGELLFNEHVISLDEQKNWLGYRYDQSARASFALKIESEVIDERLLVPYAAAFQLILAFRLEPILAEVISLEQALAKRLGMIRLKVNAFLMLSVLLILLLVNLVLFSQLDASNKRLASRLNRFAQNKTGSQHLEKQVREREQLLQSLGWDGGIRKGVLIDQLAFLMPGEISLKEIAINPVDANSSRAQRALVFFDRRISISGTSDQIIPVNEWIARIKTRPWAKNVQLDSYTYNSEFDTGQFTLTLNY